MRKTIGGRDVSADSVYEVSILDEPFYCAFGIFHFTEGPWGHFHLSQNSISDIQEKNNE